MPHFTTPDGLSLYFTDDGSPDALPLLCLAGLTRNTADFDHVLPHLLAINLRVIRMDYRGRGRSDHADPATYAIPQEAVDALALLDHLGLTSTAILGTSRGGLIAMMLAATAKDRLLGVALNDIGPELAQGGLDVIRDYIGIAPVQKTHAEAAKVRASMWRQFENVPAERWLAEVTAHYAQTPDGLKLRYDPRLRDAVLAAGETPMPDLWPLFDALAGLPLALIRGANSDLLTAETAQEMARRRPDMIHADVPGRGHVPFLDEPEALGVLGQWRARLGSPEGGPQP